MSADGCCHVFKHNDESADLQLGAKTSICSEVLSAKRRDLGIISVRY